MMVIGLRLSLSGLEGLKGSGLEGLEGLRNWASGFTVFFVDGSVKH